MVFRETDSGIKPILV